MSRKHNRGESASSTVARLDEYRAPIYVSIAQRAPNMSSQSGRAILDMRRDHVAFLIEIFSTMVVLLEEVLNPSDRNPVARGTKK